MSTKPSSEPFFEYDPEKPPKEDAKAAPAAGAAAPASPAAAPAKPALGLDKFGGRLYSKAGELTGKEAIRLVSSQRSEYVNFEPAKQYFESPVERLHRLKHEVNQFQADMDRLVKQEAVSDVACGVARDVEAVEKELGAVLHDDRVAPYLANSAPLAKLALHQSDKDISSALVNQVRAAKQGQLPGDKGGFVYELYYAPGKDDEASRMVELDRRVAAIEKSLGTVKSGGYGTVAQGIATLYRKIEFMDEHKLEGVYRRVTALRSELELLEHTPKEHGAVGGVEKFKEASETVAKWDKAAGEVSQIADRMASLKEVHENAANALLRLQRVERLQLALVTMLGQDKESLDKVTTALSENVKVLENNIKAFRTRVDLVNLKLAQLGVK